MRSRAMFVQRSPIGASRTGCPKIRSPPFGPAAIWNESRPSARKGIAQQHRVMHRLLASLCIAAAAAWAAPTHLRCDSLNNPLGIDDARPLLSWQSDSAERNWKQSAYQILVATSPARLAKPDVWDSGKQTSAESNGIAYAGRKLDSRRRYYWTVRVWDAQGKVAQPAQPAWWEMGLLAADDWKAKWISRKDPDEEADRAALHWIWVSGEDAFHVPQKTVANFRLTFDVPGKTTGAQMMLIARGDFIAKLNGHEIGTHRNRSEERRVGKE